MVKILTIGDPHGALNKIKKIPIKKINPDLILITGDLGKADLARKRFFENIKRKQKGLEEKEYSKNMKKRVYMEAYDSSVKIINYLKKQALVYFVYGNVEYSIEDVNKLSKNIKEKLPNLKEKFGKDKKVRIINNRIANFDGIRIGGLEYFTDISWVKEFKPEDYKEDMENARKETKKVQNVLKWFDKLEVLLCHQPPYGILDKVNFSGVPENWRGKNAGSKAILDYIKKKQPKYVLCGHIHEAKGMKKIGKTKVYNLGASGDYQIIDIE